LPWLKNSFPFISYKFSLKILVRNHVLEVLIFS
jgi:hypothetical protein